MSMRKLLITGFGPFPRVPRNPSERLARVVAGHPRWRRLGISVEALVMDTRYSAIDEQLLSKIVAFEPDAILMLGVAGRRKHVSIETRAMNRVSRLMPDASGRVAGSLAFRPGSRASLSSKAPHLRMIQAMRKRGVDARLSRDAGRYLCNAAYFAALGRNRKGSTATVSFVHIPLPSTVRIRPRNLQPIGTVSTDTTPFQRLLNAVVDAAVTLLSHSPRIETKS
jgi:pyroglutamyl-peptidase